jgi:hypothetical protein
MTALHARGASQLLQQRLGRAAYREFGASPKLEKFVQQLRTDSPELAIGEPA